MLYCIKIVEYNIIKLIFTLKELRNAFYTHIVIVIPILVASGSVARVQDHVAARVVQARFVPPDLAYLTEHPILKGSRQNT